MNNEPAPIETPEGKADMIRSLSESMLRQFLEKVPKIPDYWNGIEIKTWMVEEWQRESFAHKLKGNTERGKRFRSDIYNNNL